MSATYQVVLARFDYYNLQQKTTRSMYVWNCSLAGWLAGCLRAWVSDSFVRLYLRLLVCPTFARRAASVALCPCCASSRCSCVKTWGPHIHRQFLGKVISTPERDLQPRFMSASLLLLLLSLVESAFGFRLPVMTRVPTAVQRSPAVRAGVFDKLNPFAESVRPSQQLCLPACLS